MTEAPPLPSLAIVIGMILARRHIERKLSRTMDPGSLPTRTDREDARSLWEDLVNATLVAVLQRKGIPLDQATTKVALRGWNHTCYVTSIAQELRTDHAQPEQIQPACCHHGQ